LQVAAGLRWSEQNLFLKPAGLDNRAGDLGMMCTGEKVKRLGRNPPPARPEAAARPSAIPPAARGARSRLGFHLAVAGFMGF
jgi:hypothetical protein